MFTPIRRFMNKLTLAEIMREHVNRKCHGTTTYPVGGSITLLACGGKPPYVYSKDEFQTQQDSPVFENLQFRSADCTDSQELQYYFEATQRFWVKDANNNIAFYDAVFNTPDRAKFRSPQSGYTIDVYCAAGQNEATVTPGVDYPIPQLLPTVNNPIEERDLYYVYVENERTRTQRIETWPQGQVPEGVFTLSLVNNELTQYQYKYSHRYYPVCNNIPTQTCYINIYVHPYMTLSEDSSAHVNISCSKCNQSIQKGSVTLTVDGGTAPYIYSKDNFATEQSSPIFTDLCLADADCYESEDTGYLEGIQRFWVKDSNDVIVTYDAILKKPKFEYVEDSFDLTLYCAAGEDRVLITPGMTFPLPHLVLDTGNNTITRDIQALNPTESYMSSFEEDGPFYLELNNGSERKYQLRWRASENRTERCTGRIISTSYYGYITVKPYSETQE